MVKKVSYQTSRDYTHLRELFDQGYEVVCFTTYDFFRRDKDHEPFMVTDVCIGRKSADGCYSFGVRGTGFGDYDPEYHKFSFEDFCKEGLDLEYIEPTTIEQQQTLFQV